jgi:hypothetical protein
MREVLREASFAKGAKGVLFSGREVFKNPAQMHQGSFVDGSFELREFF